MNNITFKQLRNMTEDQARETLEAIRWPDGSVCPHCDGKESYKLTPKGDTKTKVRNGVYKCKSCRKQFTVTVGTVMERSRIRIADWLMAFYLMCSSKKGISAHQLHRTLGVSYETAWFMAHRIRYAMMQEPLSSALMTGTIEADETYIGGKEKNKHAKLTGGVSALNWLSSDYPFGDNPLVRRWRHENLLSIASLANKRRLDSQFTKITICSICKLQIILQKLQTSNFLQIRANGIVCQPNYRLVLWRALLQCESLCL